MKTTGLNNKTYTLDLSGQESNSKLNRSSYHLKARNLVKKVYPSLRLVEEVHVPGCPAPLYLDFFIPLMKIAIEVQGEQHYRHIQHFHKNKMLWMAAKARDGMKKKWCELNEISLIELPFDEDEAQWEERLRNVFNS